ncbi:RNA polymerase sigma factor [Puniceicoccaceae bacterium K14]|nr:RNA polymerase sigma factor [Puniceicoccaceae bacterium K14]
MLKNEVENWYVDEIEPHEPILRSWLQTRFGLGYELDDIVQESLLRTIKANERGLRMPKAFLFKVARNVALDHLRKKSHRKTESLASEEVSNVVSFEKPIPEVASRKQEYAILNDAIASLPLKCREIFTMRRIYGLSQIEIAEALGISRNTVSAQLTIGLRKCEEYFALYPQQDPKADGRQ